MNLMTMEHLTKFYTERMLFEDAGFSINSGEKVGVIGINGTGKSTLLRIAAGLEEPDEGTVITNRNLKIRYLPQNPEFAEGERVLSYVLSQNQTGDDGMDFAMEADAKAMLTRFSIPDYEAPVSQLSGGQRKRLALAGVLLSGADLLILLSDIDGLFTDDPHSNPDAEFIEVVENMDDHFRNMGKASTGSKVGTGGMATKLTAAEIATAAGTDMVIANGADLHVIHKITEGRNYGTLFVGNKKEEFHLIDYIEKLL